MLHPSTRKLIERLAEVTSQGQLLWRENNSGGIVYTADGFSVVLKARPYSISIRDGSDRELELISQEQLEQIIITSGGSYADLVMIMYDDALRSARGTETAIVKLLASLEDAPFSQDTAREDRQDNAPPIAKAAHEETAPIAGFEPISEQSADAGQHISGDRDAVSLTPSHAPQERDADKHAATNNETDAASINDNGANTSAFGAGDDFALNGSGRHDSHADTRSAENDAVSDAIGLMGDEIPSSSAALEDLATDKTSERAFEHGGLELDATEAELTQAIATMADHVNRKTEAAPSGIEDDDEPTEFVATDQLDPDTIVARGPFTYIPFGLTIGAESSPSIETTD